MKQDEYAGWDVYDVTLGLILALVIAAVLFAVEAFGQPAAPPVQPATVLTEVQRLKAENLRLRFALVEQQRRDLEQAVQKLQEEARQMESDLRVALKPAEGATWNWGTLVFDPPKDKP